MISVVFLERNVTELFSLPISDTSWQRFKGEEKIFNEDSSCAILTALSCAPGFFPESLDCCGVNTISSFLLTNRVRKTPSARQQCWPETFCESGKFFRIRKVFATRWRISGHFGKCPDTIQNIQIICNVSGWTGKFPDDLKSVGMNWNLSRWCSVRII